MLAKKRAQLRARRRQLDEFVEGLKGLGMVTWRIPRSSDGRRWRGVFIGRWPGLEQVAAVLPTLDGAFYNRHGGESLLISANSRYLDTGRLVQKALPPPMPFDLPPAAALEDRDAGTSTGAAASGGGTGS